MENKIKCGDCVHFDVQKKMGPKGPTLDAKHGWCKVKSKYAATDPDGQIVPPDVKRVPEGSDRSKPFIVMVDSLLKNCTDVRKKSK